MKREELKELIPDITKEQLDEIMSLNGKDIEKAKADYDELKNQIAEKDEIIKAREKDIADLKEVDAEGLKNKIEELETKHKEERKAWEKNMADMKKNHAVKTALGDTVQDMDIILSLLDNEKISFDEQGNLSGLDDQIKTLKESKGFLFKESNNNGGIGGIKPKEGSGESPDAIATAQARAIMGLPTL